MTTASSTYEFQGRADGSFRPQFAPVTYEKDLSTLLGKADCVALSLPLNAHTKGFFNAEKISQMKDGAILVNTARGGVVDEDALIEAVSSGKVGALLVLAVRDL